MRRFKGFSLIEVLLALAVGGILLMAASSLLVTISQAWANRPAIRDAFDAHVNGIAHFLTAVLEEATKPPEVNSKSSNVIELGRPIGFSDNEDPLIKFYLPQAPPFFYWPHGLASRVHVYFQFTEGEGLFFLWHSELQEMEVNDDGKPELVDEDQLFRTLVSPYLDQVLYCYYNQEKEDWDLENGLQPKDEIEQPDQFEIPDFIKIYFKWEEEDLDRIITIPIKKPIPSGIEEEPY